MHRDAAGSGIAPAGDLPEEKDLDYRPVLLAVAVATAGVLPAFLTGGLAVQIRAEMGFGSAALGLAVALFFVSASTASVVMGRLVERIGSHRGMRLAVFGSAASLLCVALFAGSWTGLVVCLVFGGLANAVAHPATHLSLAREVPAGRQGYSFGIKQAAIPSATLLAGLAVPGIALTFGWRWAFAGGALLALVVALLVPAERLGGVKRVAEARASDAPIGPLVLLAVGIGLGSAAATPLGAFVVESSVATGLGVGAAGLLLALGSAASIVVRVLFGRLADGMGGGRLLLVGGMLGAGVAGFVMLATGSPVLVVPGVLLAFAAGWGWPGLFNFAVVRSNPGAPAAATGVTQTGASGGAAVGPVLFGVVVEAAGYGMAWLFSGALALAALVAILAGRRTVLRGRASSAAPLQTLAKTGNVARVKSILRNENPFAFIAVLVMAVVALAAGVWGRVWTLEFPPQRMWDEIYFPVMASKYLRGVEFFDLHPPLGKFIIAWSIALFGDTPFAWRLMPAIFGCALIALAGAVGWYLFKERVAVLLLVLLFAGETILIVHSRTGVMDIFLVFFVMASFLVALWAREPGHALVTAVLLGLAISVKWAAFPVAIPAGYVLWRKGLIKPFIASLWVSVLIYLAFVYVERLIIITSNPFQAWVEVWTWHLQAADKVDAAVPHAWGSPWWSWPLMLRPIRYEYLVDMDARLRIVLAIGNPLVWWSSTLAVLAGLVALARRAITRTFSPDDPLVPIILGYVVMLLPWIPGTRIPYIYNYLPIYAFALLALAYWLVRIWRGPRLGPWLVVVFCALALAVTLLYLPLATTLPIAKEDLSRLILFDSWFYQEFPVPGSGCTPPDPAPRCF